MNKTKLLLISVSAAMLLVSCGGKQGSSNPSSLPSSEPVSEPSSEPSSTPSSEADPLKPLKDALEAFPTNYTAEFVIEGEEDDYHPTLLTGEGFFANRYTTQITGYGKIARDEGTYHRYDHYRPDVITEDEGEYFKESGRADFTDEDRLEKAKLSNYFNLEDFELTEDGTFISLTPANITGYLDVVNTSMAYWFWGSGSSGVELTLNESGGLDEIRYWGAYNQETEELEKDELWATVQFSDVGETKEDIFFNTVGSEDYDLTPEIEWLPRIGHKGNALYEGMEVELNDVAIAGILGEEPEKVYLNWNGASLINFEVDDLTALGDVYENYSKLLSLKAKIHGDHGHVVLTDISSVSYEEDCLDIYPYEIENGESYSYDFGDEEYGRSCNGAVANLMDATYEGGYKQSEKGEEITLNFSYIYCGQKYNIPVKLNAGLSEDSRSMVGDFFAELPIGSAVTANNVYFYAIDGEYGFYYSEMSSFEEGTSFGAACEMILGTAIPMYEGNLGVEFFFEMEIPGDDELTYPGLYACVDLKEGEEEGFTKGYGDLLLSEGYKFDSSWDSDGTTLYQYSKDGIVVMFTEAMTSEGYAYYIIEAANLNSPIIPETYDWVGSYTITMVDSGATYQLVLKGDGEGTFDGNDITYDEDGNRVSFQYNDWSFALQDNGDGTYWGLITTSETEYEITVAKNVD